MEHSEINLSDVAKTHLKNIIVEEMKKDPSGSYGLRIRIHGGGCSGFQYEFLLDKVINQDDHKFIFPDNIFVIIDGASLSLLDGSHIDYVEDLVASRFVIKNPNATTGCGCGNSFSI